VSLLLRPRHFFLCNPALDVPPSLASTPSQVAAGKASGLAFGAASGACCK